MLQQQQEEEGREGLAIEEGSVAIVQFSHEVSLFLKSGLKGEPSALSRATANAILPPGQH